MTPSEVGRIGMWDEASVRKALKHIEDDEAAHDLLKRLLHHRPGHRISSMRSVLEHPFFTGTGLPPDRSSADDTSPRTANSGPGRPSTGGRSSTSQYPRDSFGSSVNGRQREALPVNMKSSNSTDSIENRENNVRKQSKLLNDPPTTSSPSSGSVRSSSFGFRKRLSSLSKRT